MGKEEGISYSYKSAKKCARKNAIKCKRDR
jgi:hypothetical protein